LLLPMAMVPSLNWTDMPLILDERTYGVQDLSNGLWRVLAALGKEP
jgi:hypothetical protein